MLPVCLRLNIFSLCHVISLQDLSMGYRHVCLRTGSSSTYSTVHLVRVCVFVAQQSSVVKGGDPVTEACVSLG